MLSAIAYDQSKCTESKKTNVHCHFSSYKTMKKIEYNGIIVKKIILKHELKPANVYTNC